MVVGLSLFTNPRNASLIFVPIETYSNKHFYVYYCLSTVSHLSLLLIEHPCFSLSLSLSLPLHESLQQQPAAKPTSFVLCRNNKSIHSPSSVFILVTQTLVPHFRLKHEIWWKQRATWPVGIVFIILYSPCAHSG